MTTHVPTDTVRFDSNDPTRPLYGSEIPTPPQAPAPGSGSLNPRDLLTMIERIANDTDYLHESLQTLAAIESAGAGDMGSPGDIANKAKAQAIGEIVTGREATNRRMIELLERMYEDLSPRPRRNEMTEHERKIYERIIDSAQNLDTGGEEILLNLIGRLG